MIKYITYKEDDDEGKSWYYILQKDFPHIKCILNGYPTRNFVQAIPILGYNIWVVFDGTLRGSSIPGYKDIDIEITNVMQDMADWYYINRILKFPKRYRKLKMVITD
jgi:hypothetical protein